MTGVLSGCFGDLLMLKLNLEFALPYRKVSSQDALGSNSMENGERTENVPRCGGIKWQVLDFKWLFVEFSGGLQGSHIPETN